jgi:hypothetical protein
MSPSRATAPRAVADVAQIPTASFAQVDHQRYASAVGSRFECVTAVMPDAAINCAIEIVHSISMNLQPTAFSKPASGYPSRIATTQVAVGSSPRRSRRQVAVRSWKRGFATWTDHPGISYSTRRSRNFVSHLVSEMQRKGPSEEGLSAAKTLSKRTMRRKRYFRPPKIRDQNPASTRDRRRLTAHVTDRAARPIDPRRLHPFVATFMNLVHIGTASSAA